MSTLAGYCQLATRNRKSGLEVNSKKTKLKIILGPDI